MDFTMGTEVKSSMLQSPRLHESHEMLPEVAWGREVTSRKVPSGHVHHYGGSASELNCLVQSGDVELCLNCWMFVDLNSAGLRDCVDGPCYSAMTVDEKARLVQISLRCDKAIKVHIRLPNNRGCLCHNEHRLAIDNCTSGKHNIFKCILYHSPSEDRYAMLMFTDGKGQQYCATVKNNCLTVAPREYKAQCPLEPEQSDLFIYHELQCNMIAFESLASKGYYILHDNFKLELRKCSYPEEHDCALFFLEDINRR